MIAAVVALGMVVVVLSVLVLGLLRSHAEILRSLHALGIGAESTPVGEGPSAQVAAPARTGTDVPTDVTGLDPAGGSTSVSLLGQGRLTLLAFLSSGCLTCRPMWEGLGGPAPLPGGARPVVVTKGPEEESPASVQALAPAGLVTVMSSDAWSAFAVPGSPYFVLVDGTGRITGEGTAATWARVLELLGQAMADAGAPSRRGPARGEQIDEELQAAGIEPGHPTLYAQASEGPGTPATGPRTSNGTP